MGIFGFKRGKMSSKGRGLIILQEVAEAMKAEKLLRGTGYEVRPVAPPPQLRKGCDLAVEFDLVDRVGVERILRENGLSPFEIFPLDSPHLKPLEITKQTDLGKYLMVRAANMKLTFDKSSGVIVNISGGGCPDVPYLTNEMVGKSLLMSPKPEDIGYSLCAYMLDKAYKKALEIYLGKR